MPDLVEDLRALRGPDRAPSERASRLGLARLQQQIDLELRPAPPARRRRGPALVLGAAAIAVALAAAAALAPTGGPGARTVLERAAAAVRAGEPVILTAEIHGRQLRGRDPDPVADYGTIRVWVRRVPGRGTQEFRSLVLVSGSEAGTQQAGSETVSHPTGGDGPLPFTTELYDAARDRLSADPNTKAEFAPELFRAEGLLAKVPTGGDVAVDENADVNGRPAYELIWSESAGRVTIEHALWVDRESYAPLRLTERDTGTDTANQPVDETYEATITDFERLPDTARNRALLHMRPHPGAERHDG